MGKPAESDGALNRRSKPQNAVGKTEARSLARPKQTVQVGSEVVAGRRRKRVTELALVKARRAGTDASTETPQPNSFAFSSQLGRISTSLLATRP